MPRGPAVDASLVSSVMCGDASYPVKVYWGPGGEDCQVGAALARDPQLVGLDRLPDLIGPSTRVTIAPHRYVIVPAVACGSANPRRPASRCRGALTRSGHAPDRPPAGLLSDLRNGSGPG
jgi:hypothetical protein